MSQSDTLTLSQIHDELEAISEALSEAQMIARVVTEHTDMGLEGSSRLLSAVDRIIRGAGQDLHATIGKVTAMSKITAVRAGSKTGCEAGCV